MTTFKFDKLTREVKQLLLASCISGLASLGVFSIYELSQLHAGDTPGWLFLALVVTLLTAAWHFTNLVASALKALKLLRESEGLGIESIEGEHQPASIPKPKGE